MTRTGFYVMTYGGGRYTAIAWFGTRAPAEAEVARIKMVGAWSGMPPIVEAGEGTDYTRGLRRPKERVR